jgi:hypothetical protein
MTLWKNLLAGYGYTFRVIAHSDCGDSNQVMSKDFIAGYNVPREPPPKFKARNSGPGVVVLSWSVPAFDDVTDYTYYVTYNISMTKVKQVSFCLNGVVYRFSKFVST